MADKTFPYNAAADLDDGSSVLIDLEEHGWANKELLARTRRWSLIPKDGATTMTDRPYPFVACPIPEGAKPVFKSRWYGALGTAPGRDDQDLGGFRCFAIGYKQGRRTHLVWVLPTGDVEMGGEQPWLAGVLWDRMFGGSSSAGGLA